MSFMLQMIRVKQRRNVVKDAYREPQTQCCKRKDPRPERHVLNGQCSMGCAKERFLNSVKDVAGCA